MSNVLKAEKQQQVRALGQLGWSLRRIEEATGVRRETAARYLREAGILTRGPRRRRPPVDPTAKAASHPFADSEPDPKAASQVFADLERTPPAAWSPQASGCEPYRAAIEQGLRQGRNATAIWQDLVDDYAFKQSYECVKRFVRRLRGSVTDLGHPRILTEPGLESQVDYGTGPMVRDARTGKYRRTRLFALTLGCSRRSIWLLTFRSSSRIWAELHEKAFRRIGGTTKTIVLDNLREGVLQPDIYDPQLNPLYRDVLTHYGVVALPAKVRDPNRKGKVESSIGFAQKRLKGLRFESIEEAQAYIDRWQQNWADTRIHGTTKRQVAAMFDEEKPALQPLPTEPFRYYEYAMRIVHLDNCIEVAAAYYALPPGRIGETVHAQWDDLYVRILDAKTGQLIREHIRQGRGRYRIDSRDENPKKSATSLQLLERARVAGQHIGKVCERIDAESGQTGMRSILGVLSLVKKHGRGVVDHACEVGLDVNMPTYRFVRNFIRHQPPPGPDLRQADELIRELSHYRKYVDRLTGYLFT